MGISLGRFYEYEYEHSSCEELAAEIHEFVVEKITKTSLQIAHFLHPFLGDDTCASGGTLAYCAAGII